MFARIKNKLIYLLNKSIKPEIIGGWEYDKTLTEVRISNFTHISNKKNIRLKDNVFIGHFNYIDGYDLVEIGEGCQITNYVSIVTHSSHNALRAHGIYYAADAAKKMLKGLKSGPVKIGAYTYVGAHSLIMPNVKIGKGCIVSAYSFVKEGEYPDYSILRGIPAIIIGDTRDTDKKILADNPELENKYYLRFDDKH